MQEWIWACFLMVALHCGTLEGMDHFKVSCNDDVILPCRVRDQTEKYRYVVWYRDNSAIIKRKNNDLTLFNNSTASLGVKESLVLWRVKPYDSGKYQCFLAADIGAKDAKSQVTLTVSECMVPTPPPTVDPLSMCPVNILEISSLLALLPFSLFCLVKVGLCFIALLVCKKVRGRRGSGSTSRQPSHKYTQQMNPRPSKRR
ncbi:protein turtle homolog B [Astyanax mexicanus]|uniref:protein turtle homolog B n=1 Tax=Astyanax mexicanus TaxID=7994 RepID=UPI0020CACFCC|nr:protein turtle homolog B [Astyanax mexicanus]